MNYYVDEYSRNGVHGPRKNAFLSSAYIPPTKNEISYYSNNNILTFYKLVNWYRTRYQNYKDEQNIVGRQLDLPVLFIQATEDAALPPAMAKGMVDRVPKLTKSEVQASHWALWQRPTECNAIISRWIENFVFEGKSKI